ncbi:MAG: YcxB family protein [Oscillibacter sp.]|nr:YcxB family protein [Oscillibacter sp.]
MEKEFEIQMNYTMDDCYAFWRGFVQKKAGKPAPKQMNRTEALRGSLSCVILGLLVIVGMFWLQKELGVMSGSKVFFVMGVLLFLAGGLTAFRNRKEGAYPYWVKSAYKKFQKIGEQDIFCFSEKGFEAYGPGVDHHYDFSAIKALWADENHYYVELGKNVIYMLPHHNFTLGDPAEFPAFWIAQTGRPVLPVSPVGGELDSVIQDNKQ